MVRAVVTRCALRSRVVVVVVSVGSFQEMFVQLIPYSVESHDATIRKFWYIVANQELRNPKQKLASMREFETTELENALCF